MFNAIVFAAAVLLALLAGYVVTRPNIFRVERKIIIKAAPEDVFSIVNDFRQWDSWSPWSKRDPDMNKALSGPPTGKGAIYEWDGNKHVGKGRMEILEAIPSSSIRIKLDFLSPFKAHNTVEFTLQPEGGNTVVTWAMFGPNTVMARLMGLFFSMDRMVGKDFETGLASLKDIAEA